MYGSQLYEKLSVRNQERIIGGRAYFRRCVREGRLYRQMLAELNKTQWYSAEELRAYQSTQLEALFRWADGRVPFYQGRMPTGNGGAPLEQLHNLPFLDRADVRAAGDALRSRRFAVSVTGATSGTTGTPLLLRHDLRSVIREQAFSDRQLAWAGYRLGERRAWWRGDLIVPVTRREPPYWRNNRAANMLMLSSYHLAEDAMEAYRCALERFDPVLIQAYPSSIGFLARYLQVSGQQYRGQALRAVVTSSETLMEDQRVAIEQAMGCPVYNWYGGYERVAAIGTCEHGSLHLLSDYSLVEMLPGEDELKELIGTSFHERAMPLIRYRTGDQVAIGNPEATCACGRAFPVIQAVFGRQEDLVHTPDGRRVGRLDQVFKGVSNIAEAQIRQACLEEIEIAVVPLQGYGPATERVIRDNARARLGHQVKVHIVIEERLPRSRNGKVKGVVSEL